MGGLDVPGPQQAGILHVTRQSPASGRPAKCRAGGLAGGCPFSGGVVFFPHAVALGIASRAKDRAGCIPGREIFFGEGVEFMKIIDLSRELYHRAPAYPGQPPIILGTWKTHEEAFADSGGVWGNKVMYFSMPDHGSTHLDAPRHFHPDGMSIGEFPLEKCIVTGLCLDLRHIPPRAEISSSDLRGAVEKAGARSRYSLEKKWQCVSTFMMRVSLRCGISERPPRRGGGSIPSRVRDRFPETASGQRGGCCRGLPRTPGCGAPRSPASR